MKRVLSALALLPLVVGVIGFLPPVATLALAAAAALLALREYAGLAAAFGARVFRGVAVAAVVAAVAGAAYGVTSAALLAGLLAVGAAGLSFGRHGGRMLIDVAASAFPLLYISLPLGAIAGVRMSDGAAPVLLLLGLIAASDTAQYYGGRWLGRTPLAAAVSPGKTVEGALFGAAAGVAVMVAAGPAAVDGLGSWPPAARAAFGLGVVGLGVAGDLFESLLKRGAGVKDASALIPGHGGVLDRIDSLLFAGPGFYLMMQFL